MTASETGGRCDRCGFDPADWNEQDTANTLRQAEQFVALWADGVDPDRRPPVPNLVTDAVDPERRPPVPNLVTDAVDPDRRRPVADRAYGSSADRADPLVGGAAGASLTSSEAVHRLWHHLDDLYRLAVANRPVSEPRQRGVVEQVSASGGGVPKLAVDSAEVGWRGMIGDTQAARRHHGRPWQALCLWSGDVIDALAAEGHPIQAGAAGENLTIRGLEWGALRAGMLVDVGSVRCRLSAPAVPCAKNNQWFADGDSRRIDHDRHPGWSRWYASVLQPGHITTGAPVVLRR